MKRVLRLPISLLGFGLAVSLLSGCDPNATVSGGVYYDSVLWNDYYYGHRPGYRPPPAGRPPRPEHPIARPPVARPPIHRPPVARPMPAGL